MVNFRNGKGQHQHQQVAIWSMLDALRCVLTSNSVVAIASDKSQKIAHEHYRRVERFGVGKRHVTLLMLANSDS